MITGISSVLKSEKTRIDIEFNDKINELESIINGYKLNNLVNFTGVLKKEKDDVLKLTGVIEYEYDTNCFRCLKDIHNKKEMKVDEDILNAREPIDKGNSFTYEGDRLDLSTILKNYIVLSLPMKEICKDDCKGLCPLCGEDLNEKKCGCTRKDDTNPQMEKLRHFFD